MMTRYLSRGVAVALPLIGAMACSRSSSAPSASGPASASDPTGTGAAPSGPAAGGTLGATLATTVLSLPGGAPGIGFDDMRFVAPRSEVWVTEPDAEKIEIFTVPTGATPTPVHAADIAVRGGPESLVVDAAHGRAYTHLWHGQTFAIDVAARSIAARWPNGCS